MDELFAVAFWASAVRLAAPMFLAATGEIVAQRAGVFNIAIEGMMLIGAFAAVAGGQALGSAVAGVAFAAVVVGIVGLLYGVLVVACRADQVVAGIGFNIVALGATSMLRSEFLGLAAEPVHSGSVTAVDLPVLGNLPFVGPVFFEQSPLVYVAYVLIPLVAVVLFRSRVGLVVRSTGERASAADAAGVRVVLTRILAVGFGGVMAGVAGAYLSVVATGGVFIDGMTNGRGFLAIAIVIFGRWHPAKAALAALLFGAAEALQFRGQALLGEWVSPPLLLMAPFILAIATWVFLGRSKNAPGDLGKPFIRAHED